MTNPQAQSDPQFIAGYRKAIEDARQACDSLNARAAALTSCSKSLHRSGYMVAFRDASEVLRKLLARVA